ncbi:MAG: hypothetical protein KBA51_01995 [Kiritimatiellae bacterium]|nr:hypothetical protein [Kiritimatiellia bacterium]
MKRQAHHGARDLRVRWMRQIRAWLDEWEADRSMVEPVEPAGSTEPVLRYDAPARAGEIWLLHPTAPHVPPRPVYMAVLWVTPEGGAGAAPFSRFHTPAYEGEWSTGRRAGPLRVLGLGWLRVVPAVALTRGWRAGRLTGPEWNAVRGWLESDPGDEAGHPALRGRCGPPLVHPEDPRWEYVREETAWLDAWAARAAPPADAVREDRPELSRAADAPPDADAYRVRRKKTDA